MGLVCHLADTMRFLHRQRGKASLKTEKVNELYGAPQNLSWIHVPKCGSSFGASVFHYACPGIPDDALATCIISRKCEVRFFF